MLCRQERQHTAFLLKKKTDVNTFFSTAKKMSRRAREADYFPKRFTKYRLVAHVISVFGSPKAGYYSNSKSS
jgi:hypothetical protein